MDVDDGMGVIVAAYLSPVAHGRSVILGILGRPKSFVKEGEDAQWMDEWMNPQIPIPMDEIPFDVASLLHHRRAAGTQFLNFPRVRTHSWRVGARQLQKCPNIHMLFRMLSCRGRSKLS